MKEDQLLNEIINKYSEWLETAGENAPALLTNILVSLLAKSRSENEYYQKRLNAYER